MSIRKIILSLVAAILGLSILAAPAFVSTESKVGQSVSAEAALNRWSNHYKSHKHVFVKLKSGTVVKVQPGRLFPKSAVAVRAPYGYRACNYSVRTVVCNQGNSFKWTKIASTPLRAFTSGYWHVRKNR